MKSVTLRSVFVFASLLALSPLSHAQLFRAYVSASGSDSNPCTVSLPCRLLPAAVNAVAAGGEVWMLDSANFNSGTVTISKDVTIMAVPGQVGSIVAAGGAPAIETSGTAAVKLRNVVIANNAVNPGTDGIRVALNTSVSVENSVIDISSGSSGVYLPSGGAFSASNTVFRGNRSAGNAILASGGATVAVASSRFEGWLRGVFLDNGTANTTTAFSVTGCVFSRGSIGVYAFSEASTKDVKGSVTGSTFEHGNYGVVVQSAGGSAVATVGGSMFVNLGIVALYNVSGGGAALETLGTNSVRSNNANSSGPITSVAPM